MYSAANSFPVDLLLVLTFYSAIAFLHCNTKGGLTVEAAVGPSNYESTVFQDMLIQFVVQVEKWQDGLTGDQRSGIISEYHTAGISLIVSAFGGSETPTTSNFHTAVDTADMIADWVIKYGVDGVDINYEVCFIIELLNSHY